MLAADIRIKTPLYKNHCDISAYTTYKAYRELKNQSSFEGSGIVKKKSARFPREQRLSVLHIEVNF